MSTILAVALLTLATSFLCSLFEAALYAITPSQVELLKQSGRKGARRLERLRADIEEPIAAILTLNTIAHTVGAAWCGAMVAQIYGDTAVLWFATFFTVAVLVLTEIIPKSLGVRHASTLAPRLAVPLQIMTWIAWPVARPTRAAMRMFSGHKQEGPSEEEVLVFAKLASRHGQVRREEGTWVENALNLDQVRVKEIMTPRPVVESFPGDMPIEDAMSLADRWIHSRVPLTNPEKPEEFLGMLHRREVFDAGVSGKGRATLQTLCRELESVPDSMQAHQLLRLFLKQRRHMVAVVDEYGSFQGIVTLEDVLETLLGSEIVDEYDQIVDMQAHARESNPHASEEDDSKA